MSPSSTTPALTVYFDGSCPLCHREIAFYKRLRPLHPIDWVDVSQSVDCGDGLHCERAMQRFHVRRADGHLLDGAQAFAALWRQLPGWRWLGLVASVPPVSWIAELAYRGFLPLRPRLQRWFRQRVSAS
jgi:predicted DCC family thiol-disulfide oxidoreductase YuxK